MYSTLHRAKLLYAMRSKQIHIIATDHALRIGGEKQCNPIRSLADLTFGGAGSLSDQ